MGAHSVNHFDRIPVLALHNSRIRKTNSLTAPEVLDAMPSTAAEMHSDWVAAVSRCVREMLTSAQDPLSNESCFEHLTSLWLDDLKNFNAYHAWCSRLSKDGIWSSPVKKEGDYYTGCHEVHDWLLNSHYKHDSSKFAVAKTYIEERYLKSGKVQLSKPEVDNLIKRKATRIWETSGNPDEVQNWEHARNYVETFYGNIVSAIENNSRKHINAVLNALQNSYETNKQSLLVNGFEAALAIHFFDLESIAAFEKHAGPIF